METVRNFLESSSICGLSHISTSNSKAEKVFWVVVVLASVTMTGYLTTEAFVDWSLYPISTTTETFPITEVQFPNIVVCPPKVGCRLLARAVALQSVAVRPTTGKDISCHYFHLFSHFFPFLRCALFS